MKHRVFPLDIENIWEQGRKMADSTSSTTTPTDVPVSEEELRKQVLGLGLSLERVNRMRPSDLKKYVEEHTPPTEETEEEHEHEVEENKSYRSRKSSSHRSQRSTRSTRSRQSKHFSQRYETIPESTTFVPASISGFVEEVERLCKHVSEIPKLQTLIETKLDKVDELEDVVRRKNQVANAYQDVLEDEEIILIKNSIRGVEDDLKKFKRTLSDVVQVIDRKVSKLNKACQELDSAGGSDHSDSERIRLKASKLGVLLTVVRSRVD